VDWLSFARQVAALRRGMAAAGLRRGDRLAMVAPVSLAWELVHHAALSMGVSVVGLDAHDLPERLAGMADQAGVTAFAVRNAQVLGSLSAERLSATRLLIDLDLPEGDWPKKDCRQSLDTLAARGQDAPEPPEPVGGDEATVIFTSGTTGAPKGIAYTHSQLGLAIDGICDAFPFVGTDSRQLCWLPLSNLFQRIVNLAAVQTGTCTYLLSDPRQVMDHVAAVAPDVFIGVPRFYEKLHEGLLTRIRQLPAPLRMTVQWAWSIGRQVQANHRSGRLSSQWLIWKHRVVEQLVLRRIRSLMGTRLRCMVSGSAPMPTALLEEFEALGWPLLEAYGLSENVLPMAMNRLDDRRLGTVGRPLAANQIVIGDDGMVRVRGPGVFSGYLGESPGTGMDPQGYYLTGDLGSLDADGYLRLTGRLGDLIKTSTGRRVAPAGVEAVLQSVDGVDQAVLLGAGRKYLLALCTCAPGGLKSAHWPALQQAIQLALRGIGPHERPAGVLVLDRALSMAEGELTTNLKLRRQVIAACHTEQLDWLSAQIAQRGAGENAAPLVLAAPSSGAGSEDK
jgi:long-chain acyl-CoA synthetase